MISRVWAFRIGAVLLGVVAFGIAYLPRVLSRSTCISTALMEDKEKLRALARLLARWGILPLKDGALDPYVHFRNGDIVGSNLGVFRSARSGTGPTDEEIERGDYTNFPWERYRGDGKLEGPPFPLLWERKPDEEGMILVGLSDGTAAYWTQADLAAALRPR